MYDLKINNARIISMETGEEKKVDIGIEEGKIVCIGECKKEAKQSIDVKGFLVSPGFVDIHIHEEELEQVKEQGRFFTTSRMILEGVTTVMGGNCGSNRQPIKEFKRYIDEEGAPVNYLSFIGHRYLRECVGNKDPYRESTQEEIEEMARIANGELEEHAIGISFGLEYSPGATLEEVLSLLEKIHNRDILLAAHYRKDAKHGLASVKEMIEISRRANLPFQISHLGSCTAFGMMDESLKLIEDAMNEGVDLSVDCYPYAVFASYIGSAVFDEGCFELWNKSYEDIELLEEPYKGQRCTAELFELARKEYPMMMAAAYVMEEEEVVKALQAPYMMIASDGMFRGDTGHPRSGGTFPKVLGRYVREAKVLTLHDALRKMTQLPARRLRLKNKGELKLGYDADLVIFDPEKIIDQATFEAPTLPPLGIEYVIIGGEIAVHQNQLVKGTLGRFISQSELRYENR